MSEAQLLADRIYRQYHAPALITDLRRKILAFSDQPEAQTDEVRRRGILLHSGPEVVQWLSTFLDGDEVMVRVPENRELDTMPRTVVKVMYRSYVVGYVFMLDPGHSIPDDWADIHNDALTALGLEIELSRSRASQIQRATESALSADAEEQALAVESLRFYRAFQNVGSLRVAVAEVNAPVGELAPMIWEEDVINHGSWTSIDDRLVLLVDGDASDAVSLAQRVLSRLARFVPDLDSRVGVGGAVSSLSSARTSYVEALGALRVCRIEGSEAPGLRVWDTMGVWRLLVRMTPEDAARSQDPRVSNMVQAERFDDVRVLREYLERDGDVEKLATSLHLHRSTVYSRIRRLEVRHNFNFARIEDRAVALLGLRLLDLHPTVTPPPAEAHRR